jgi:hypothetical protein
VERKKPEVGQKLYSLNVGNAARGCESKLTPVIVDKVGRKYFYTSPVDPRYKWQSEKYHIDSWEEVGKYLPNSCLYEDPQIWEDEKECGELVNKIKNYFDWRHHRKYDELDKLRKIVAILEEPHETP